MAHDDTDTDTDAGALSLYDQRPFFEKALLFGVAHGLLDQAKLDTICADAPKGIVQIARYFGRPMLQPELERARARMVNLISLHLESSSGGDLRLAAELLRDHSLLSRSKAGADLLKAMLALPDHSHFGMQSRAGFSDEHIPLLEKWCWRSLLDYQTELARRQQIAAVVAPALWLAQALELDEDELTSANTEAEAVIRTALLVLASGGTRLPDWVAFEAMVVALRKKYATKPQALAARLRLPPDLPPAFGPAVEPLRVSVLNDLPKILDTTLPARKLFYGTPAFLGRYFWIEDMLSAIDQFDRSASAAWNKLTAGRSDDASLLTLLLCVAANHEPKTVLTQKVAKALVRKIRKSGLQLDAVERFIADNAPAQHNSDYTNLWHSFIDEAQVVLLCDHDQTLKDALTFLDRECHIIA